MEARIVDLGSENVWVNFNRSSRARHISIFVGREGVKVTAPHNAPESKVYEFLRKKEPWILKKVRYFSKFKDLRNSRDNLLVQGQEYRTEIQTGAKSGVFLTNDHAIITLQKNTKKELKETLEKWYRTRAKRLIPPIVHKNNTRGHKINRISIRNQKTRWASCAKTGNLNFNLKLAMAPREIVEYIVIHELAHLDEMNHSKRFWKIVAESCPDYKKHVKWLRTYGLSLDF